MLRTEDREGLSYLPKAHHEYSPGEQRQHIHPLSSHCEFGNPVLSQGSFGLRKLMNHTKTSEDGLNKQFDCLHNTLTTKNQ